MIAGKNNTESFQRDESIPQRSISANEVHVWSVCTESIPFPIRSLEEILSNDELERAGKFYFEKDQRRFIIARGMLRMILSSYLGEKPQHLRFAYAAFGKPMLARNAGGGNIYFNLSHSEGMALYAISTNRDIGIDVERIRNNINLEQIAKRFFSAAENNLLERIDEEKRPAMFFKIWTRKEAVMKAIGKGFSFPMEQVDASSLSEDFWSKVELKDENKCLHLAVKDLAIDQSYAAAIAVAGNDFRITCHHYSV